MTANAPAAPGRLGEPVDPAATLGYLSDLDVWIGARRAELDGLDRAAQDPDRLRALGESAAALTGDIALSLALWKAVHDRAELLVATWDSGRVAGPERERIASLIWGRLDATLDRQLAEAPGGTLAVSLPEACQLSDALAAQLRRRLRLDADGDAMLVRVRQLRASVERLRDQVALEPPALREDARRRVHGLARRLDELVAKADRGGDVGGLIGPLEHDAARTERDLIVTAAKRREASGRLQQARELRRDLEDREAGLRALVDGCLAAVDPAPKYAVPDVEALGPVPNTAEALADYLARLGQVSRAMQVVQHAYSEALAARKELLARLEASARASESDDPPRRGSAAVAAAAALARSIVALEPTPVAAAERALDALDELVSWSRRV